MPARRRALRAFAFGSSVASAKARRSQGSCREGPPGDWEMEIWRWSGGFFVCDFFASILFVCLTGFCVDVLG